MLKPWAVGEREHGFGVCIRGCILYHCIELSNESTWVIVRLMIIPAKGGKQVLTEEMTFVHALPAAFQNLSHQR